MGPPNVLGLPNPASSMSTTRTFGAPAGAFAWPISPQSGSEPARVWAVVPEKGARRMGSTVRSVSSVMWVLASCLDGAQLPAEDSAGGLQRVERRLVDRTGVQDRLGLRSTNPITNMESSSNNRN